MRTTSLFVCVAMTAGCQLTLDLGEYAYQEIPVLPGGPDVTPDVSPDQTPEDMPEDMLEDLPEEMGRDMPEDDVVEPADISLIFTELLTNTSQAPQELSEYFEVVNLSSIPIDPNDLLIKSYKGSDLFDDLNVNTFDREKVSPIPPMGHFTFVRRLVPEETGLEGYLEPGAFYEYGINDNGFALGNSGERRLELYHVSQDLTSDAPLDTISWTSLKLKLEGSEGTLELLADGALSLNPQFYGPTLNDNIEAWCYESNLVEGPSIGIKGSPGHPLSGACAKVPEP